MFFVMIMVLAEEVRLSFLGLVPVANAEEATNAAHSGMFGSCTCPQTQESTTASFQAMQ